MAALLVSTACALAVGCGKAARTTETLSGTVAQQSSVSSTVAVVADGQFDVTLSSIDPSVTIGLGIGQFSGTSCSLLASNSTATAGTVVSAEVQAGTYCVSVYDVGTLSGSVTYSLTVTHP